MKPLQHLVLQFSGSLLLAMSSLFSSSMSIRKVSVHSLWLATIVHTFLCRQIVFLIDINRS